MYLLLNYFKSHLIVVLSQLQHFFDDGLIVLAVLAVVLQGQTLHPALLMQVQQHLNKKSHVSYVLPQINKSINSLIGCETQTFCSSSFFL